MYFDFFDSSGTVFSLVRTTNGNGQEVLKANGNGAILLCIALPEGLGETLHLHAQHNELVHRNLLVILRITLLHQEIDKLRRETEAHLGESCQVEGGV